MELHEYNITMRAWTDLSSRAKGSPPPPASLNGISLVPYKSKLYTYGRVFDIHEYDLASDTWTRLEATSGTPPAISQYMGFAVHDGKFFVFGGISLFLFCQHVLLPDHATLPPKPRRACLPPSSILDALHLASQPLTETCSSLTACTPSHRLCENGGSCQRHACV
eukprot:2086634-Rhodomonas_salina.1